MTATVASGLEKAQQAIQSASSKNKKTVDLSPDTVDACTHQPQTTDHGVRIRNPDNWLKVTSDRKTGPSLLEDNIAREKVNFTFNTSSGIPPNMHM
jgi:catalase